MELKEAIRGRRSVRTFLEKDIENELIDELISEAIYAPTASNAQAWKFIVIDCKKIKELLSKKINAELINRAQKGILVLYRKDVSVNYRMYKDHIQSASAFIQNLLLLAHEKGIGTCWWCNLPHPRYVRKILNIPKHYDVISYVCLGYPKEYLSNLTLDHYDGNVEDAKIRKRKYSTEQVISYNTFVDHSNDKLALKHAFLKSCLLVIFKKLDNGKLKNIVSSLVFRR